jgi:hypothetical protein
MKQLVPMVIVTGKMIHGRSEILPQYRFRHPRRTGFRRPLQFADGIIPQRNAGFPHCLG